MTGRIIILFALAFSALIASAYFAGTALDTLVNSVRVQTEPSRRISVLHDLQNELLIAENSVRNYSITGNADDLSDYYRVISLHGRKFEYLQLIWQDSMYSDDIMELSRLLEHKHGMLEEIISLDYNDRVEMVLDRVVAELSRIDAQEEMRRFMEGMSATSNPVEAPEFPEILPIPESEPEIGERQGFLRRIFGGRRNKKELDTSVPDNLAEESPLREPPSSMGFLDDSLAAIAGLEMNGVTAEKATQPVSEVLKRVGQEEIEYQSRRTQILRMLLAEDREVSALLYDLMSHMERQESRFFQNTARSAAQRATSTKWTILLALSASATLLILLVGVIIRDMARLRRKRTQLRIAKEEAEKLARIKQEFLSNMSHEIRTPLTAIAGFAGQLSQTSLDEEQHRQLDRLIRATGHLQSLIVDLLDLAKMERGVIVLQKEPFALNATISGVIDLLHATAEEKGIELRYLPPSETAFRLLGDPLRLKQILINLLGNAIAFTDSGFVELRCTLESTGKDLMLRLEVEDSGIGIPEKELNQIFKTFAQVDNALARRHGGAGLGLSIVKHLVELQGGQIEVRSRIGVGTVFLLRLPYTGSIVENFENQNEPHEFSGVLLKGKRILVVDDDPFIRELIGTILLKWEATLIQAPDARTALEYLGNNTVDLVLMDLRMPGMDGGEAVRIIRGTLENGTPPVIAVTADSDARVAGLLGSGFDGVLVKPFTEEALHGIVERYLCGTSSAPECGEIGKSAAEMEEDRFSMEDLQEMSGGNPAFVRDMLRLYVDNMEAYIRDLEHCQDGGQWLRVSEIAHKAAPGCRHLGLSKLAAAFRRLEQYARSSETGLAMAELSVIKEVWKVQKSGIETEIESLDRHMGDWPGMDKKHRVPDMHG